MTDSNTPERFATDHQIEGLTEPSLEAIMEKRAGYTIDKAKKFLSFQQRIDLSPTMTIATGFNKAIKIRPRYVNSWFSFQYFPICFSLLSYIK